jgi:hypothetical protein
VHPPQPSSCDLSPFMMGCEGAWVRCARPWNLAKSYPEKCNKGGSIRTVSITVRNGPEGGVTIVEDSNEVVDGLTRAVVGRAAVEVGKGSASCALEVAESNRGVRAARRICVVRPIVV